MVEESKPQALGLQNILVPVDFSDYSKAALEKALAVADQFNARVHVLFVLESATFPDFNNFPLALPDKDLIAKAKSKLVDLVQRGGHPSVPVYPEVRSGVPWQVIVECARREKAELIIIPTHGYTGVKHVLLGSTAERVVRHAPCAVLVLRGEPPAKR